MIYEIVGVFIFIYSFSIFIYSLLRWHKIAKDNDFYIETKGEFGSKPITITWWILYLLVYPFWAMYLVVIMPFKIYRGIKNRNLKEELKL